MKTTTNISKNNNNNEESSLNDVSVQCKLESECLLCDKLAQAIQDMFNRDKDEIEKRGIARKALSMWKESKNGKIS